jgi:hypothetical protein
MRATRRGLLLGVGALALAGPVRANVPAEVTARLTPEQLETYRTFLRARAAFDRRTDMYWALIEERKDHRRRRRAANQPFVPADFVTEHPPKYSGPTLPPDIQRIVAEVRPPEPERQLPVVADYLAAAREAFGFVPTPPASERAFKRAYAIEALSHGLTKSQVVRVYALETGGDGTYDMQAGFHPVTRQGRAISSALGYAQLLHANSVSELVKHGDAFMQRLSLMSVASGIGAERSAALRAKVDVIRRMLQVARSVPNQWAEHVRLAGSERGMGIHTLNLDADVGPWLQTLKLRDVALFAAREGGRTSLTGGELEIMNLAGPRNGLDMLEPVGGAMPTANFFSQGGYSRNSIVRERTGAELLRALDERMDINIRRPGAVEFAAVFDEVAAQGVETAAAAGRAASMSRTLEVEPAIRDAYNQR